jgi:hypothetical protein
MPFNEDDRRRAPWLDYEGNEIYEGDWIIHPDGEMGKVVFVAKGKHVFDKWRVDYGDGGLYSGLSLQIGEKGMGVVCA